MVVFEIFASAYDQLAEHYNYVSSLTLLGYSSKYCHAMVLVLWRQGGGQGCQQLMAVIQRFHCLPEVFPVARGLDSRVLG